MTGPLGGWVDRVPYCVSPSRWESSEMIVNIGGPNYRLLFWSDTDVGFEHLCHRPHGPGLIICAPRLIGHVVMWEVGPDGVRRPTVRPSVSCPDCGTHGFITNGRWANA